MVYSAHSPGTRSRDDRARLAESSRQFQWTGFQNLRRRRHTFQFHASRLVLVGCSRVIGTNRWFTRRSWAADTCRRVFHRLHDVDGGNRLSSVRGFLCHQSWFRVSAEPFGDGLGTADLRGWSSFSRWSSDWKELVAHWSMTALRYDQKQRSVNCEGCFVDCAGHRAAIISGTELLAAYMKVTCDYKTLLKSHMAMTGQLNSRRNFDERGHRTAAFIRKESLFKHALRSLLPLALVCAQAIVLYGLTWHGLGFIPQSGDQFCAHI